VLNASGARLAVGGDAGVVVLAVGPVHRDHPVG
jgi:hypothetical protein